MVKGVENSPGVLALPLPAAAKVNPMLARARTRWKRVLFFFSEFVWKLPVQLRCLSQYPEQDKVHTPEIQDRLPSLLHQELKVLSFLYNYLYEYNFNPNHFKTFSFLLHNFVFKIQLSNTTNRSVINKTFKFNCLFLQWRNSTGYFP